MEFFDVCGKILFACLIAVAILSLGCFCAFVLHHTTNKDTKIVKIPLTPLEYANEVIKELEKHYKKDKINKEE
jgi:hypothetical protein